MSNLPYSQIPPKPLTISKSPIPPRSSRTSRLSSPPRSSRTSRLSSPPRSSRTSRLSSPPRSSRGSSPPIPSRTSTIVSPQKYSSHNLTSQYQQLQRQMYPPPPLEMCSGDVCCVGDICRISHKPVVPKFILDKEWSGTSSIKNPPLSYDQTTKNLYRKYLPEPSIQESHDEEPRVFSPHLRRRFQVPPVIQRSWDVPSYDPYYNS